MTREEAINLMIVERQCVVECEDDYSGEIIKAYDMAIEALSERTGEWIPHAMSVGDKEYIEYSRCSECGEMALVRMNYCPNCGADMRGGKRKEPKGFTADEWYKENFGENNDR